MSSFDSVTGPSTTVRLPPENLTRAAAEVGFSPERSSRTPSFCSSSLYFPIAAKCASVGIWPASDCSDALKSVMYRMVHLLVRQGPLKPALTETTNERQPDRHAGARFWDRLQAAGVEVAAVRALVVRLNWLHLDPDPAGGADGALRIGIDGAGGKHV